MTLENFLELSPGDIYISPVGSKIKILSLCEDSGRVDAERMDTGFRTHVSYEVMPTLRLLSSVPPPQIKQSIISIRSLGKPRSVS